MARPKAAQFEDELTLVEHLDELRSRLIYCGIAIGIALVVCFWQNHLLLGVANAPLPDGVEPITLSPSEPFMTTITISLYGAILLTLPIILHQAYQFLLPAIKPEARKTVGPMLYLVPILFIAGVLFSYFVVFPAAIKFLLNFNDDQFNIQLRAREYYSFFSLSLLSVGDPLPDPDRRPRSHPARDRHPRPARQEQALRDPRLRRAGDAAAGHRPDHDADLDGAAGAAVRVQPADGPLAGSPREGRGRAGSEPGLSARAA